MRRDMDLIRKMILAIEDHPSGWAPQDLTVDGYAPHPFGSPPAAERRIEIGEKPDAGAGGEGGGGEAGRDDRASSSILMWIIGSATAHSPSHERSPTQVYLYPRAQVRSVIESLKANLEWPVA
jgi:hypothetical protein